MVYVTVKQSPCYHQMTLEEFLFSDKHVFIARTNETNTRTYITDKSKSSAILTQQRKREYIEKLREFNASTEELRLKDRKELYREFYIPKRSGGLRRIDAPQPELMDALRRLKSIFENDFGALYHTSAFAYIKGRSTVDAVKRHQQNESRWFGKYDLHDFFGSTTPEFVMKMFSVLFPFSEITDTQEGYDALRTALDLAFLNGGLPQGTPISPLITNLMMIPVDHAIANTLRDYNKQKFVYTRYADDFIISSRYDFSFREIEKLICDTLNSFGAPFQLNKKKTRYGSNAGSNWNLGIMLNKDNEMTVGSKNKRRFQAMLTSYVLDRRNGKPWDIADIQVLDGYRNYYRMIERDTIDGIVKKIGDKFGVEIPTLIKQDLRAL